MQDCFLLRKKKEQIAAKPGVTVEALYENEGCSASCLKGPGSTAAVV